MKNAVCCLSILFCLLGAAGPALAQPYVIERGFDLFRTLEEFESEQGFAECPISGLTFESASDQPLTGCETFDGFVGLKGAPLERFRGVTVGAIDTIVERKTTLDFGEPMADVTLPVDVELVALNLVSSGPVPILCDQGLTQWAVAVEVDQTTGPSDGDMEVTLDHPALTGGTVSSILNICPRVTFTRVDPGGTGSFEIYPCDLLCGPQLVGETSWSFELPAGTEPTLSIEGFTTDNFFFVEPPAPSLKVASEDDAKAVDPLTCECGFLYPHLSANHRHQACGPCPCDADIEPPLFVTPPFTVEPPFECSGKDADGQGGIPAGDQRADSWLNSAVCDDATSPIEFCGAVNPPDFFALGLPEDPPAGCVGSTTVQFQGEDKCENKSPLLPAVFKVRDTTGPEVEAGDEDFECLTPPNGGVVCFGQDEPPFELEAIKQQFTGDLCSDVADWWFVGCASDQADSGPGSGNRLGDCTVGIDQRTICVRSERDGGNSLGRRYSVEIQAMDECGNTGEPEVVGFLHVPRTDPGDGSCIVADPPIRPECNAENTSGQSPLTVSFSDDSHVQDTTTVERRWDFGDGSTLAGNNAAPSHEYTVAGTYSPRLEITLADGNLPFTVSCPAVTVNAPPAVPPTAACSADPSTGDAQLDVDFTDLSTEGSSPIVSWSWDFDDGDTSSDQNPSHEFTASGTYDVTLTVSDGALSDTATCRVVVTDPPPTPTLTADCAATPDTGGAPLDVTFVDQSTASNTTITSWLWDFGDGTTSTDPQPALHIYSMTGIFDATLTVSDGTLVSTATCPVVVDAACSFQNVKQGGQDKFKRLDVRTLVMEDVTVTKIYQDEPLTGCGAGNKSPDGKLDPADENIAEIRTEACSASGYQKGRFYFIEFKARDGGPPPACGGWVTVCVPANQGNGNDTCLDDNERDENGNRIDSTVTVP